MPPRTRSCGPMPSWWSFRRWGRRRGRGRGRRRARRSRRRPTRRRPMPELHHTIVAPVVTEKSSAAYGARKEYAFRVHPEATKPQIRAAIESLFKVSVTDVRTTVVRAKRRSYGRYVGRRPSWKKAIVTLKEGDTIAVFEGRHGYPSVHTGDAGDAIRVGVGLR